MAIFNSYVKLPEGKYTSTMELLKHDDFTSSSTAHVFQCSIQTWVRLGHVTLWSSKISWQSPFTGWWFQPLWDPTDSDDPSHSPRHRQSNDPKQRNSGCEVSRPDLHFHLFLRIEKCWSGTKKNKNHRKFHRFPSRSGFLMEQIERNILNKKTTSSRNPKKT